MAEKLILKHRGDYDYFLLSRTENSEAVQASLITDDEFEQKLSKQNCDEIFGVVNIEKLISEADTSHLSLYTSDANQFMFDEGFKIGFNKAIELNKDKEFTKDDIRNAIAFGVNLGLSNNIGNSFEFSKTLDRWIEIIQQEAYEIQVEVEMEWMPKTNYCTSCGNGGKYLESPCDHKNDCENWRPKLNENGCLILKKA